jgi:superfamily II DNA or RNA helicase
MPFAIGERVRARSNPALTGEIVAVLALEQGDRAYRVRFANGVRLVVEASLERDVRGKDPREQLAEGALAPLAALRLLLTGIRLRQLNLTDQIRSLRAARLEHFPYQYKPLLKFLDSEHQRVLIADEVGLGKTIEAAFVLSELTARADLKRVLIVVPSNLRSKWQRELALRFDEQFEIRDAPWIQNVLLSPAVDDELPRFRAIVSIEGMRRFAVPLEERRPPIDLVIIDEAHRLRNEGTFSFRLGRALSDSAEGMLLCSATPLQTKDRDLYNLLRVMLGEETGSYGDFTRDLEANRPLVRCGSLIAGGASAGEIAESIEAARRSIPVERVHDRTILDTEARALRAAAGLSPARRAELLAIVNRLNLLGGIITRTRKRDVMKQRPERIAKVVDVTFTPQESEVYESITAAAGDAVRRFGEWSGAALAMISRARQAASCLAVFVDRLQTPAMLDEDADASLAAERESADDPDAESESAASGKEVDRLLENVRKQVARTPLPRDSKLKEFLGFLSELREEDQRYKVVVFSTFRDTVGYLGKMLREQGIGHRTMTGLVAAADDREAIRQAFRDDPACHVLLTTEVGGEGIDLQFCNVLVNYDLPWNPMVVEQRIGRLDRIGQLSPTIRIVAFDVKDTIESRILERLYRRIELFKDSVGPLEVILGEHTQKLSLTLLKLSPAEQERSLREAEVAIETARMQADQLDLEAVTLLGDDAFYEQRLAEIERAQGNISRDLEEFVRESLSTQWPHATLVAGRVKGALKLTRDTGLVRWLTERGPLRAGLAAFARRYAGAGDGGLDVTFDQEVAESLRNVEFLTSRHPFIACLASEIEPATAVAAFAGRLETDRVPRGTYVLCVGLQQITGLRPRREIVAVGTLFGTKSDLASEDADWLLFELAEKGLQLSDVKAERSALLEAANRCDAALIARAQARAAILQEENAVFIERRIGSLERWYGRRIDRAERLASGHADDRVRRMNAGQREWLRSRLEGEIAAAREKAAVTGEAEPKAYVVLKVANK